MKTKKKGDPIMTDRTMSEAQRQSLIEKLGKLSHEEMAYHWRFDPIGGGYFSDSVVGEAFKTRFIELGGMTPEISKKLGSGN